MRYFYLAMMILVAPAVSAADRPCSKDAPCEVEGGEYFLAFPDNWDGLSAMPAIIFYHGHNSSGLSPLRSRGLRESFLDRGYLLISPNGAARPNGVRAWPARPGHGGGRDDVAFSLDVLEDAATKAPINPQKVIASGFSAGGSMAWMMGCYAGDRFAAIISVAGAMRRPHPDGLCPNPAPRALQVHGFADKQVPFEGRGIREWHQGDVHETLSLFRRSNRCRSNPDEITVGQDWRTRHWWSCEIGDLAYMEHDGGHGLPRGWTNLAAAWFEEGLLGVD